MGESGFHARSFRTTKLALSTRLQSLLNSRLFCDLAIGSGWSSIDLPRLLQSRRTIVFAIGKNKVGDEVAVTFGKFLVGLIQAYCMLRPPEARVPVYLYLDEFHNFVSPGVKELFTELRKFGLHLTIAQQYEGQEGNRDIATAIAANTAVKIVGRTADPASALKMASKVLVDETAVRHLRIGEFFVRVGNAPTCKLQIPDTLLRAENRLGPGEWQRVSARQAHAPAPPPRRPQDGVAAMRAGNVSPDRQTPPTGPPGAAEQASAPPGSPRQEATPQPRHPDVPAPPSKRRPKHRLPGQS
jgi:hypothetical protein